MGLTSTSTSTSSSTAIARALDWSERLALLTLYTGFVARLWHDGRRENLALLASDGLVIALVLVRRPASAISGRAADWLVAGLAGSLPMLASPSRDPAGTSSPVAWVGLGLLAAGLLVQVFAKLSLGRSFGCIPAHRGLVFAGPYRVVRHPTYAGYLLGHVGFLAIHPTFWNLAVYVACSACQLARIQSEERLLAQDPEYLAYQSDIPRRLIPGIY